MRTVFFEKQAFEDVKFWSSTNPKILKKVVEIIIRLFELGEKWLTDVKHGLA